MLVDFGRADQHDMGTVYDYKLWEKGTNQLKF